MPPPRAAKGGRRVRRAKVRLGDVASITLIMVSVVVVSVLAARYVPFLRAAEQWLTDLRASAGIGVSWISPVGPLRIAFAKPLRKQTGDKTQTVQFSIGTAF